MYCGVVIFTLQEPLPQRNIQEVGELLVKRKSQCTCRESNFGCSGSTLLLVTVLSFSVNQSL
jgi:hypothetical protein